MSIYNTGITALRAAQTEIATTGHNIANANTAGYRRQEVVLNSNAPVGSGSGFIGQGVNVTTVRRIYDDFLERQVSQNESQVAYQNQYLQGAKQIDALMGNREAGLSTSIQAFFQSWNDLANNPASEATRQSVLSSAHAVADNINSVGGYLQSLQSGVNTQIQGIVNQVNSDAASVASINQQIAQAQLSGQAPNDLLDKRDQMISDLNKLVGVTVVKDTTTGSYNLFMGGGYQLVVGGNVNSISAKSSPYEPARLEVFDGSGSTQLTSRSTSGGQLGGVLGYRSQVLDTAQNALGRIAASLTEGVNAQHKLGVDYNGAAGGNFFNSLASSPMVYAGNNTGVYTTAATITNAKQLTGADYMVSFDGSTWTVKRQSDGQAVAATVTSTPPNHTLAFDGLQLTVNVGTSPTGTDTFLVRPTETAATNVGVAITDTKLIAAKGAGAAATDTLNNTNALAMSALQTDNTLVGNNATLEGGYSALVGLVGTLTSTATSNLDVQQNLLTQAQSAQQSTSGVNLDEEAGHLVQYQQAYQAAAQIIKTASTMFDTLLSLGK